MPYQHPGKAFLAQQMIQSAADVARYVEFLRQSAALSDQPPIDLTAIYQHFGMPIPMRVPLEEQQGILLDSSQGIILIKEDDPIARQRFTEGHELMELLFDALAPVGNLPKWDESDKERLCDQGAADLLMPQSSFRAQLEAIGLSLETGRSLAQLYQTSLMATLVRMIQLSAEDYALVLWHEALKPIELKPPIRPRRRRLRVWWQTHTQTWTGGFIPKAKSIPATSLIGQVHQTGEPQAGQETINWGATVASYQVAAMPVHLGEKRCIVSLLQPISLTLDPV
jgi:Zn-dependent peptidase ImmA (M78 family)